MILVAIIVVAIIALGCFAAASDAHECPRQILGYNCRGDECDHSMLEVQRAKDAMERRYW